MKFLTLILVMLLTVGCQHTRGAYKAAEGLDEYAFVVSEHYDAILGEAAAFVELPDTSDNAKRVIKQVSQAATPLVRKLRPLSEAYTDAQNAYAQAWAAQNPEEIKAAQVKLAKAAAELQKQTTDAVVAVANLIKVLRAVQAVPTAMLLHEGAVWGPDADYLLAQVGGVA